MDREVLKQSIKTSKQPQLLDNIINAQLYTGYRVVVYRMNTAGIKVKIPGILHELDMDYLLSIDPSNSDYIDVTTAISDDSGTSAYMVILDALYGKLKKELDRKDTNSANKYNKLKGLYVRGNLVSEYDITALVSNINTNLDIEGINTCNLTCIDPSLASFRIEELQRLYAQNPWLQVAQSGRTDYDLRDLPSLKAFKFREYDLIRVSTYSSLTQSLPEKIEEMKKILKVQHNDDLVSLLTEYCMPPSFTGFVQSINNVTAANSVSQVNVSCSGVARVLAQTSTVVDQALANSVVVKHRELLTSTSNNKATIATTANIYSGNSSLSVFSKLLKGNLYPKVVLLDGEPVAGQPSLSNLYDLSTKDPQGKELKISNVVPLFPSLVALHYLKEKFSELIFYCDDALEPEQRMVESSMTGVPVKATKAQMLDALRPYMYMLKNSYELYDSEYQSPYEILGTIRANAYMEIFEDRTGMMRLRFPKYNNARIDAALGPHVIMSANINRSDSNNFSIVRTRFMADLIGAMRQVLPDVFVDALSLIRFGFRMSAPIENPNSISQAFSRHLAPFVKFYSALRESRTASLSVIGSSKVNLGQMASFRYGYKGDIEDVKAGYQNAGVSSYSNAHTYEYRSGDYVGYVTNISETIGVDQVFTQNLTLKFLRDAQIFIKNRSAESPTSLFLSPAATLANGTGLLQSKVLPLLAKMFVPAGNKTFTISVTPPPNDFPMVISTTKDAFFAAFSYIPSALDLARWYLIDKPTIDQQAKQAKALQGGEALDEDTAKSIEDQEKAIDSDYRYLGILYHQSAFLKALTPKMSLEFVGGSGYGFQGTINWAGKGWDAVEAKLSVLIEHAFKDMKYDPNIKVPGIPPNFRLDYGDKNVPVTRYDYNFSVEQIIFVAQTVHDRTERKFSFVNDFTRVLSIPKSLVGWGGQQEWTEMWKAFIGALETQQRVIQNTNIPYKENTIKKMVDNIQEYNEQIKKEKAAASGVK